MESLIQVRRQEGQHLLGLVNGFLGELLSLTKEAGDLAATQPETLKERLTAVFDATHEVIRPALFGVFIITAVYVPIFSLTGQIDCLAGIGCQVEQLGVILELVSEQ